MYTTTTAASQKAIFRCGLGSGGVIRPFFFDNECGQAVTVDKVQYRNMVVNFFGVNYMV